MGSKLFYPQATGQIADNLYAVQDRDTNLFLYTAGESTLCIDAGYIHNHHLGREFERIGVDPASITHLFLTHTDMDHAGSIDKDSKTHWFEKARVFLGRDEVCMIDGSTSRRFIFRNPVQITRPYQLLDDGAVVEVGATTVQAIATPGHTPGHMAYLINGHILCSGDALVLKEGGVEPFYQTWNIDHALTEQSVRKLAGLEGVTCLCTAHTRSTRDFEGTMRPWRK
jgi:glyoxylase-like metal-dependent hydrolase (beta-lactamase superfamily II)